MLNPRWKWVVQVQRGQSHVLPYWDGDPEQLLQLEELLPENLLAAGLGDDPESKYRHLPQ